MFQLKREVRSRHCCQLGSIASNWLFATRTGIQVKLDVGIFLSLGAVVVRPALDNLHILELEAGAGRLRDEQNAECNRGRDGERGRGEEAEGGLHSHQ